MNDKRAKTFLLILFALISSLNFIQIIVFMFRFPGLTQTEIVIACKWNYLFGAVTAIAAVLVDKISIKQ